MDWVKKKIDAPSINIYPTHIHTFTVPFDSLVKGKSARKDLWSVNWYLSCSDAFCADRLVRRGGRREGASSLLSTVRVVD